MLCYPLPAADGEVVLPAAGARWPLARESGGYTVTNPQAGLAWRFEPRDGFFVSVDGHGELPVVSLTDRAGRQIRFGYRLTDRRT